MRLVPSVALALAALAWAAPRAAAGGGPVDAPAPRDTAPAPVARDLDLPEFLAQLTGFWKPPDPGAPPGRDARTSWTMLPLLFANPLMGLGGGAAAIGAFRLGPTEATSFSKLDASAFFTEHGQRGIVLRSEVHLPRNGGILVGDWGAGAFPNPAWGIGGDTTGSNETIVSRRQVQILETAYWRIAGRLYSGLGYWLDHFYGIEDRRAAAGEATAFSAYGIGTSGRSTTSGATLSLLVDGRDSPLEPTRGVYLLARYRFEPEWLGNQTNWRSIYLDGRTYLPIPGRTEVLALWAYAWSSFGATPYLLLPSLGADPEHRSGRGYTEGRYTAKDLLYAEAEVRFHLWQFLGGVAAVNLAAPSDRGTGTPGPLFRSVHPGLAAGLRMLVSRASRSAIAADAAWAPGERPSFYVNANATF